MECGAAHGLEIELHLGGPGDITGFVVSSQSYEDLGSAPEDLGLTTYLLGFLVGSRGLVNTGDV